MAILGHLRSGRADVPGSRGTVPLAGPPRILVSGGQPEPEQGRRSDNETRTVTRKTPESPAGPSRYGVFDLETRRSAAEVGGWNRADRMGVSCAVLYDSGPDRFLEYGQDEIGRLEEDLRQLDLVVGFNILRFDYKVLSGLSSFDFKSLPTLDLLTGIHRTLGYRLTLDNLARATLNSAKSADGLMALAWWKQGLVDRIREYCRQDVTVTRDLYRFGLENRYLLFVNKAGALVRVPVSW